MIAEAAAPTTLADWMTAFGTVGAVVLALALLPIDRYRRKREGWDETRRLLIMAAADPTSAISTDLAATLVNALSHQTRIASDDWLAEIQQLSLVRPQFHIPDRHPPDFTLDREVEPLQALGARLTILEETHWWQWAKRRRLISEWLQEPGFTRESHPPAD